MTYNFVLVTVDALGPDGSAVPPAGGLHFQVSDFVWDATAGTLVVVPAIDLEAYGANVSAGTQIPLLAMDNPTLNTSWSWTITASLPGVTGLPVRKLAVNYANGPTQALSALLAASTVA